MLESAAGMINERLTREVFTSLCGTLAGVPFVKLVVVRETGDVHFINANRVDRLHTVVAPMLIGSGRPGLLLDEIDTLDQARRPRTRSFALGDDRLYDLELSPRS